MESRSAQGQNASGTIFFGESSSGVPVTTFSVGVGRVESVYVSSNRVVLVCNEPFVEAVNVFFSFDF